MKSNRKVTEDASWYGIRMLRDSSYGVRFNYYPTILITLL
jgi:hypothetical protein